MVSWTSLTTDTSDNPHPSTAGHAPAARHLADQPEEEALDDVLHERPQLPQRRRRGTRRAGGEESAEVPAEAPAGAAQGQAPHHPALQAHSRHQPGTGKGAGWLGSRTRLHYMVDSDEIRKTMEKPIKMENEELFIADILAMM